MSNAVELTTATFDETVLKSSKPYLVDFWAAWCGPCRALAPVIDEIAAEKTELLNVGKLNVDENQEIAQRYRVMCIPTLLLLKDGKVVASSIGAAPKANILKEITPHL